MKEKVKSDTAIRIQKEIENTLKKDNFLLVDIDIKGGKNKNLIIFLYKEENFQINELETISKKIYPVLETLPFLKDGFFLEISTPGIFREIKYKEEFNIFKEKKIRIVTKSGEVLTGILSGLIDNLVYFIKDDEKKTIEIDSIVNAKLNG